LVKVALMVMSDTETHADRARVANALTTAYEFKEAREEVDPIFTGAGTKWVAELSVQDHRLHKAFEKVKDEVSGACKACATAASSSSISASSRSSSLMRPVAASLR
jgi:hypothetical protein